MNEPKIYLIEIAGQMPDAIYERALQEVVRCKDCDYGLYDGKTCCRIDPWFDEYWFDVEPDGFCAWGERR